MQLGRSSTWRVADDGICFSSLRAFVSSIRRVETNAWVADQAAFRTPLRSFRQGLRQTARINYAQLKLTQRMRTDTNKNIEKLEADLWEAADNLRANSKLISSDCFMPLLGVIVLRHAENPATYCCRA
jgi:hypothetical protein